MARTTRTKTEPALLIRLHACNPWLRIETPDAAIQTSGLLGANYIGITAGGSDKFLTAGSQMQFTQSAMVLENLINKFFANSAGKQGGSQ